MVYDIHHADVLRYCLRRTGRDDAADVASEVFTVAWRRIADLPEGDGALPWLYGVAANTLANYRRSSGRRARLVGKLRGLGQPTEPAPETQVVRNAEHEEVHAALARLRPGDREILTLAAWEGLTAPEIADRFDISVDAAEKRLTRAKARLADALPPARKSSTSPRSQEGGSP